MKKFYICALLFCASLTATAQQQIPQQPQQTQQKPKFDPKVFQQHFEAYTAEQADFTKDEATKFFALYNEMQEKERSYYRQIQDIIRNTKEAECDDKTMTAKVNKMHELEVATANLEATYLKKFRKVISDRKYWKFKKAEMQFHSRALRGAKDRKKPNTK